MIKVLYICLLIISFNLGFFLDHTLNKQQSSERDKCWYLIGGTSGINMTLEMQKITGDNNYTNVQLDSLRTELKIKYDFTEEAELDFDNYK